MKTRLALIASLVLLLGLVWLLAWPVPIAPLAWQPGPNPWGNAPWQSNGKLSAISRIELGGAVGPEDVEILPDDSVLVGVKDGGILRWRAGILDRIGDTGGRPLGLVRAQGGGLWIADGERGLLHMDGAGRVEVAATSEGGLAFGFPDDVDQAPDGTVYFTDADSRWGPEDLKYAMLEGRPNGRLLSYDPETRAVSRVLDGLHFCNGVAVGPSGAYLLLTETLRLRVLKVWLTPEKYGQTEVVLDNLPGYPDNVTHVGQGVFWVALYGPRSALKDRAMASPLLRTIAARIPGRGLTRTRRHTVAVAFSHLGRVLQVMDDPTGSFAPLTSVTEHGGALYLGSLEEGAIGKATAPLRVH